LQDDSITSEVAEEESVAIQTAPAAKPANDAVTTTTKEKVTDVTTTELYQNTEVTETEKQPSSSEEGLTSPPELGVFSFWNLFKLLLVLGVFGGIFWWIGGMRLVARYIPALRRRVGGKYTKVQSEDPEK
jgi:hypothetical protein